MTGKLVRRVPIKNFNSLVVVCTLAVLKCTALSNADHKSPIRKSAMKQLLDETKGQVQALERQLEQYHEVRKDLGKVEKELEITRDALMDFRAQGIVIMKIDLYESMLLTNLSPVPEELQSLKISNQRLLNLLPIVFQSELTESVTICTNVHYVQWKFIIRDSEHQIVQNLKKELTRLRLGFDDFCTSVAILRAFASTGLHIPPTLQEYEPKDVENVFRKFGFQEKPILLSIRALLDHSL